MGKLKTVDVSFPVATSIQQFLSDSRNVAYVKIYTPKVETLYRILWGQKLVELDAEFPSLKNANNFIGYGAYVTVNSAIKILRSLPAYSSGTHNFKDFYVHIDGETDEAMHEAVAEAEGKGWTLALIWEGTPTAAASTYSLRRGRTVFAKMGEPNEDGTPSLDWGHYVTNWEAHGYREFGSVEEAAEFFGVELEPVAPVEE
jgi:hypothetical protein